MRRPAICLASFLLMALLVVRTAAAGDRWPDYRGPQGDGHSDSKGLPTTWSEQQNVAWKAPLPGKGWSTPVIEGKQVWLTAAEDEGKALRALCVQRDTGELLHNVMVFQVPKSLEVHATNSHASPSAVVEPGRVYVHFGSNGTACLDTSSGEILWKNDSFKIDHQVGPGSSPVLYGDLLILNFDGTDQRFVVALNKKDGSVAWKQDRSQQFTKPTDQRKAFCTPLLLKLGQRTLAVNPGADRVSAYDPKTGEEVWYADYEGFSNVPRPVAGNGMIFLSTGYMKPRLLALRPEGKGDITKQIAWEYTKQVPAKPSPVVVEDALYMMHEGGVLTCLNTADGTPRWTERVGGQWSASMVYADGRIYIPNEEGQTLVFKPGATFEQVALNQLDGKIMASPAVVGRALYLRTEQALYRIENRTQSAAR